MIFLAVAGPTPGSSSSSSAVALFRSMVAVAAAFSLAVVFWGAVWALDGDARQTTTSAHQGNDREFRENRDCSWDETLEIRMLTGRTESGCVKIGCRAV